MQALTAVNQITLKAIPVTRVYLVWLTVLTGSFRRVYFPGTAALINLNGYTTTWSVFGGFQSSSDDFAMLWRRGRFEIADTEMMISEGQWKSPKEANENVGNNAIFL